MDYHSAFCKNKTFPEGLSADCGFMTFLSLLKLQNTIKTYYKRL